MDANYVALAINTVTFAATCFFAVWFFRWQKRQDAPNVIEAALKVLISKQDLDFKNLLAQLESRNEKRMDRMDEMSREKEENIWHVLEALREQGSVTRADIMWLRAKVNGSAWKPGGIASGG